MSSPTTRTPFSSVFPKSQGIHLVPYLLIQSYIHSTNIHKCLFWQLGTHRHTDSRTHFLLWKLAGQWRGPGIGTKGARTVERARGLEEAGFRGVTAPGQGAVQGQAGGSKPGRREADWSTGDNTRGLEGWAGRDGLRERKTGAVLPGTGRRMLRQGTDPPSCQLGSAAHPTTQEAVRGLF